MTDQRPMHRDPAIFARLQALYADGEQMLGENRLEEAVAAFTEGLELDDHFRQRYVTMYAQRAFALQRLGRAEEALADYGRAIELEPEINQAQYHFHSGMCLAQLGQHEEAVLAYGLSIALHPDHPGPYHLRGQLLAEELGRPEEALPDLERLVSMAPSPKAYSLRGFARLAAGQAELAIPDLEWANSQENMPFNDYLLASAHAKLDDEPAMLRHVALALAGEPSYAEHFESDEEFEDYRDDDAFQALLARARG